MSNANENAMVTVSYKRYRDLETIEKAVLDNSYFVFKKVNVQNINDFYDVGILNTLSKDEAFIEAEKINKDLSEVFGELSNRYNFAQERIERLEREIIQLRYNDQPKRKWYQFFKKD